MDFILRHREILEIKANHGFTDLEIALGAAGPQQVTALCSAITMHTASLKSPWGLRLKVDLDTPVYEYWYDGPTSPLFYRRGKEWLSQAAFYQDQPFPGLHLAFVRPADDEMPCKGQDGGDTGGRPNLAGGIPALGHYCLFGSGPYANESPFTVDLAMARTLRSIVERQIVPHVYTPERGTAAWCSRNSYWIEHKNPADANVPYLFWDIDNKGLHLGSFYAHYRWEGVAAPAAVGLES